MNNKVNLIKRLQEIQNKNGFVSQHNIDALSKELDISTAHIYGVATFYAQFRLKPLGRHTLKICRGTACHVAGSFDLASKIREMLKLKDGEDTTSDNLFTVEEVACLGCCSLAPAVMIDKVVHGKIDEKKIRQLLDGYR